MDQLKHSINEWVKKVEAFWHVKTAKQKWQTIMSVSVKMTESMGIRVFSDMKVYWYSYLCGSLMVMYVILVAYTLLYYFLRGEYLRGLDCTYTAGTVSLVRFKSVSKIAFSRNNKIFLKQFQVFRIYWKCIGPDRFRLNSLTTLIGLIVQEDKQPSLFNTLCENVIEMFLKLSIIGAFLVIISHTLFAAIPLYFIVFKQTRITPMCLEMPFLERDSEVGFLVNLCVQGVLGLVSMLALVAIEIPMCSVFTLLVAVPKFIRLEVKDMERDCYINGNNSSARVRLRNIVMKIQDFIE